MAADSSAVASAFAVFATNVSPTVPEAVLRELFGILGTLKSLETRPGPRGAVTEAVVEYEDLDAALTALKLSGVELGGRPMVITAYLPASASPPSLPSGALLAQHDPAKAEEIVRTAYVGNVANSVNESELKSLFESCGPIVAIKVAGDAAAPTRFAFVEFAHAESVPKAIALTGYSLHDRTLKINQSKNAINKPSSRMDSSSSRKASEGRSRTTSRYGDDRSEAGNESDRTSRRRDDRRHTRSRSRSRDGRKRSPERNRRERDRDRSRERKR